MSEQLWYTWSTSGFGTANGNRVRAASPNLIDVEGQRIRNFVNLLDYTLSRDTDLYLPPHEAPLCLTFLKTDINQESVLIQKTYTGPDGLKRPGAFFSHLIADLPSVPSKCLGGKVPFSAREAINLWRATALWRDTDKSLRAGERNLESVPSTYLYSSMYAGPLNEQYVMRIPELFCSVLQAFLTLALSGERKRLYLAGSPDTVAILIWGITHALPRTLTIMRELTFSTFESNIENDAKPLIVGTCWLPQYLQKGHENALLDLPAPYYQANNPYGIAINCDFPQEQTPFTPPHSLVAKYTQFALDCFRQESMGMSRLTWMLDKAEKRNISEIMTFLNHYVDSQEMLDKVAVTRILQTLHNRVEKLIAQAERTLQQDRPSTAVGEAGQMESIEAETEMLAQGNVQQSIINLMLQDPNWWKTQGQPLISNLYQLAYRYKQERLAEMGTLFFHNVTASKAWRKNEGADLISPVQPFVPDAQQYVTPQQLLLAFAKEIENYVWLAQKELRKALLPLATSITDQLVQAVQTDQFEAAVYWSSAFKTCVELPRIPTEVWTYLLQQLATGIRYTNTYKELWRQFCQSKLSQLRPYVSSTAGTAIASAFTTFAVYAGKQLLVAIQADDVTTTLFWGNVLATCAPADSEPTVWISLLSLFAALAYTSAYEQWWQDYGKTAMKGLQALTNQNSQSELGRAFSSFIWQLSSLLQSAIKSSQLSALSFWVKMLLSVAPASSQPSLWIDLLLNLQNVLATPSFKQWWYEQGSEVVRSLSSYTNTSQGNITANLAIVAQAVASQLSKCIIEEVQRSTHEYEATITFLFDVLKATAPPLETGIWLTLLQNLSSVSVSRQASWELRARLLHQWKSIPALQEASNQTLLRPWLEVSWPELERFLVLDLPDSWSKIAITRALETYASTPPKLVFDTVKRYQVLFENVLQELIKAYQTQLGTIQFFTFLAQQGYTNTISLLDRLLIASSYQINTAEQLLVAAQLSLNTDIVELLENHCQDMLANYELPPTMLRLIEQYLANFDVEYLDTDPTRTLLLRLRQREEVPPLRLSPSIQQAVEGWYKIAEFLAQPQASHNSLRVLSYNLRDIKRLMEEQKPPNTTDVSKKLTAKLTPRLVELVTTDVDLVRVIDNLGRGNELQLLQDMAKVVGEKYGQERPPVRIAPYVRIVLAESNQLESSKKEIFIDTSFQLLFKQMDVKIRDKYLPEPLWPRAFVEEWNASLNRLRSMNLTRMLNRFREAASKPDIPALLAAYDPLLDAYLTAEEHRLIGLTNRFMQAYTSDNDVAIVQAQEALKQYYPQSLYTHAQVERILLACQRIAQQQAVNTYNAAGQSVGKGQSSSFSPATSGPPLAFPSAGNAENSPFSQASSSTWQPSTPARNETPANPVASQGNVAIARGQSITAAWLTWVLPLRKLYITEKINDILLEMKRMEDRGEEHQKQYKQRREEHRALKKLQDDEKRLREVALYDLIQDIFIQEEIADNIQRDAVKRTAFDETRFIEQLKQLYNKFHIRYQQRYPLLGSNDANTVRDVQKVLAMFVRREQFTIYLAQHRKIGLDEWWREQLQREGANINIDYKQAGLRQGAGSFWSRFGS